MRSTSSLPEVLRVAGALTVVSTAVFMIVEWIMLVGSTKKHEILLGVLSCTAAGMFLATVRRSSDLEVEFRLADLLTCWRLPWYVAVDLFAIIRVLLRDLYEQGSAPSLYRVSGFVTAKDDPRMVGRRVLATAYATSTPNAIVIGIDTDQSRLLFHQLERSPMPTMLIELGAKG